jgi:hypothetical protein
VALVIILLFGYALGLAEEGGLDCLLGPME